MLTKKQLTAVTVNAITVKMLMTYPRYIFMQCGNAAWLSLIFCTLIAVILFGIIRIIYKTDGNVITAAESCGGRGFQIIIGITVFAVMSANFFGIMRIFPEIIRLVLLQGTYSEIIGLSFSAVLAIGAMCGIESIGRVHAIFIPLAGIVFVIFLLILIPEFKLDNLFPVLGTGAFNVFIKGISGLSVFSDLLMLNILIPMTKSTEIYKKSGTKAIWIGGICAVLIALVYGLSYEYPITTEFVIPVYQLERLIHLGDYFSRLEAAFQFVWSISILLYGSLYIAVLSEVWKITFKLKYSKPLILPITAMLVGAALIPQSLNDITFWECIINKWIYIPAFLIPIAVGAIKRIKKNVSRETFRRKK